MLTQKDGMLQMSEPMCELSLRLCNLPGSLDRPNVAQ